MKDLKTISREERQAFIKSFNHVLCGVNGVLWHSDRIITSAPEAIEKLRTLGKRVIFVSNNSTVSQQVLCGTMRQFSINAELEDLIFPSRAIVQYLRKEEFSKKIFFIGVTAVRRELEIAGFEIEEFTYNNPRESIQEYINLCTAASNEVGAVVVDFDPNITGPQLEMALTYLRDPTVLFITGGSNKEICRSTGQIVIGPGMYHNILEEMSGRKPLCFGKPEFKINSFIVQQFGILDPSKVLFIGDSVPEDMVFATHCRYQKLLVLSGVTRKQQLDEWNFPEKYKPNYYIESLAELYQCLVL